MRKKRVAILISGRGSNMAALIEAARDPAYPAEIVGVLSNVAGAGGLERAARAGIATATLAQQTFAAKAEHEAAVTARLEAWGVEIVCLAGYMRLLSAAFVERWAGRLINIHPSLLPAFKGLDTHARALAAGAAEHGCTVHFVTAEMDGGPVIAQARIKVLGNDTPETLAARVLLEEHRLYPEALRLLAGDGAPYRPA
ncbi:MAG: phosphoribosylglycinamide formyltransferase [Phyllobacteriaceae bacterium]|nr:phosphoribosylglycinamide formyltransferase [Phyllobacteriaceae bacterium]